MDPTRFDSLAKSLAGTTSRRRLLQGMAGGIVAGLLGRASNAQRPTGPLPAGV